MADMPPARIDMQRIPVGRSIGAGVLVVVVLLGLFLDLPGIRATVVWGGGLGILFGLALIAWRRRH